MNRFISTISNCRLPILWYNWSLSHYFILLWTEDQFLLLHFKFSTLSRSFQVQYVQFADWITVFLSIFFCFFVFCFLGFTACLMLTLLIRLLAGVVSLSSFLCIYSVLELFQQHKPQWYRVLFVFLFLIHMVCIRPDVRRCAAIRFHIFLSICLSSFIVPYENSLEYHIMKTVKCLFLWSDFSCRFWFW